VNRNHCPALIKVWIVLNSHAKAKEESCNIRGAPKGGGEEMRRQAGGRKTVCMNSSKSTMESWTTDVMNLINGNHVVRYCLFAFSLVLPLLTCRLIYSVVVSIPISFRIVFLIVCKPFITRSMYTFLDPFSTTRRSFYRAPNTGVAVIMPSCFVLFIKTGIVRVSHFRNPQERVSMVRSKHKVRSKIHIQTGCIKKIKGAR